MWAARVTSGEVTAAHGKPTRPGAVGLRRRRGSEHDGRGPYYGDGPGRAREATAAPLPQGTMPARDIGRREVRPGRSRRDGMRQRLQHVDYVWHIEYSFES